MKGFKQLSLLLCAGLVGALIGILATTQMPNLSASEEISHPHVLLAHESREATCTQAGNRAYWSCTECNTFFSDAYGLYEIKPDEFVEWTTIAPIQHATNENYHKHYQAPTCAKEGNIDYYVCMNGCGGYFADSACEIELKNKDVTLNKIAHDLNQVEYVSAKSATCAEPGNKAHYRCNVCQGTFLNPSCTQPSGEVLITVNHKTDAEHFSAYQPATCLTTGVKAHYDCINCGQHFEDENCYEQIEDVVIPQKEHSSYASHYTAYQAPTCEKNGNIAYYTCLNGCKQKFADIYCEELLTDAEVVIDAIGHNYVLTKVNENQLPEYQLDEHGNYKHGLIEYQYICDHDGCHDFNGSKKVSGFGKIDATNNISDVTTSITTGDINGEATVYDYYILDWANSTLKTDANGQTFTEITVRIPGTYHQEGKYIADGIESNLADLVYNYRVKLVITNNRVAQDNIFIWQFDWNGDGIYEQIIKVQVNNYHA